MNDYIIRATAANDQIRAFAAVTTEMVIRPGSELSQFGSTT